MSTAQAPAAATVSRPAPATLLDAPDQRDGRAYVMPPDVELAVDVALATGRPLLLRGEPGSGKSSLAAHVALTKGWRYYEHIVTSQTQARDLLWSFDSVRRLADAQAGVRELPSHLYVEPGVLWWAFAPALARRRGMPDDMAAARPAIEPLADINEGRSQEHAVVLIDEIDKADPDLPNGLLVPLSASSFVVTDINRVVGKAVGTRADTGSARHLVVITTNEERELPEAFLRRCVVVWLGSPDAERLVEIAGKHLRTYERSFTDADEVLCRQIAQEVVAARAEARRRGIRPASTAEYLDALRACRHLGISADHPRWQLLRQFVLLKPQQPGGGDDERDLAW